MNPCQHCWNFPPVTLLDEDLLFSWHSKCDYESTTQEKLPPKTHRSWTQTNQNSIPHYFYSLAYIRHVGPRYVC